MCRGDKGDGMNLDECTPEGIQLLTGILWLWVVGLGGMMLYGMLHEPFMSLFDGCRKIAVGGCGDRKGL